MLNIHNLITEPYNRIGTWFTLAKSQHKQIVYAFHAGNFWVVSEDLLHQQFTATTLANVSHHWGNRVEFDGYQFLKNHHIIDPNIKIGHRYSNNAFRRTIIECREITENGTCLFNERITGPISPYSLNGYTLLDTVEKRYNA